MNFSKDFESEAFQYIKKAAKKGHLGAITIYSTKMINFKIEKCEDVDEDIKILKNACDRGNINAIWQYGFLIYKSKAFPSNPRKSAK